VVLGATKRLDPLATRCSRLIDVPRDRRGTDKRDRGNAWMSQQRVDGLARAVDDVQYALGKSRLEKYLGQPLSPQWRPLGRLEDERVPRDDGEREHPKRDHHREVEGWDAGADADRVAVEILVDAARDVAQGTALEERRRAAREIDHLDAAPHLAPRLLERLAVVARDDRSQLFEVLLEQSLEPEHQAHALHQGCARPAGECPDRRVDRSVDVGLSRQWHLLDLLARGGIEDRQRGDAVGRRSTLVADEVATQ